MSEGIVEIRDYTLRRNGSPIIKSGQTSSQHHGLEIISM